MATYSEKPNIGSSGDVLRLKLVNRTKTDVEIIEAVLEVVKNGMSLFRR